MTTIPRKEMRLSAPPIPETSSSAAPASSLRHDGKVRVNAFGHIGYLVTTASAKVGTVAINGPFIAINNTFFMFQCDSAHSKFHRTAKAENRDLVFSGKDISTLQERRHMLVPSHCRVTADFTTMEKAGYT